MGGRVGPDCGQTLCGRDPDASGNARWTASNEYALLLCGGKPSSFGGGKPSSSGGGEERLARKKTAKGVNTCRRGRHGWGAGRRGRTCSGSRGRRTWRVIGHVA